MKFPSLVRLPKHKKFGYKPRHHDPVMDDLDERVRNIKREMGEEVDEKPVEQRIRFRKTNVSKGDSSVFALRILIIVVLTVDLLGYYYLGFGKAFQLILLSEVLIFYIWFRFLRRGKKKNG